MATDQACQGSCKTTKEVHGEGSSQGMATDEASQDVCEITGVHEEGSSQGMATNEASQYGCETTRVAVKPSVEVNEEYRSLFEAVVKGDWNGAWEILFYHPDAIKATLLTTASGPSTVRDIAIAAGQNEFVECLVDRHLTTSDVTKLRHFSRRGQIRKIKELVNEARNRSGNLGLSIGNLGLSIAIKSAPRNKEVIRYLATQTTSFPKFDVVMDLIKAGHWDILLYLVKKHPGSMTSEECQSILEISTFTKSFYRSGAQLNFWEKCIYQCIPPLVDTSFDNAKDTKMAREPAVLRFKILLWNLAIKSGKITYVILRVAPLINRIGEMKLRHECLLELANLIFKEMKRQKPPEILQVTKDIVIGAVHSGIFEIVKLCLEQCPELMWDEGFTKQLIEGVVRARNVELFRLLTAYNKIRELMYDLKTNYNLMAAVVEWSPGCVSADVSGSAFVMQRELQWFEILEDEGSPLLQRLRFKMKKDEGDPSMERRATTFWDDFVEKRQDLLQDAGRWVKDTSSSCSFVATLITTVAFAAALTVPGSNDNSGIPIFLKKTSFTVFAVADALALFSSVTATLMFLTILTSRYAIRDFHHSLPTKMILGLIFLFLSLAFMFVAFGSTLTIVLIERWNWIYIPITLLATIPIISFAILQLPLYVEMVESTYRPRLYRPMKIWK